MNKNRNVIWLITRNVPPDHSGAGLRCVRQAKWFAEKGFDISVISHTKNPTKVEGVNFYSIDGYKKSNHFARFLNLWKRFRGLEYIINKYGKPDVIHSFGGGIGSSVVSKLSKKYGIKSIVEVVVTVPEHNWKYKLTPNCYLRKYGLKNCDVLLGNSEGVKKSLESAGYNREIGVINNAIDTTFYSPIDKTDVQTLRKKLGLPLSSELILMVGKLCLRKSHDVGIKVLHELLNNNDVFLVLVGPYSNSEIVQIEKKLESEEIQTLHSDRVIKIGQVNNVADYYKACDLFLFPSRKEGMPNVVLEAMSSKIPVIASRLDGITDTIIEHGKTGYLVTNNRVDDYLKYSLELINDSERKERITVNARESVKKKFSEEVIYSEYEKLYKKL